ncbi:TetR/AcrR family transcriptional regulator [Sporosarcina sp. HYO08]|uniref:TetR/AcrR family transcriptional regulator n=1 Tax=Sporosarcina sp. HYO08 TaxID=1759557 RepID=UPI00079AED70|nr:TetR/AcrR family transcriptional regulator [Sporosarcina sp. HYO08]KXH84082.1 TetR family transcriptional regulator [Sporosarcina sp. HYO08]
MNNKKIQMSRMWKYFVDATAEIIEEEGIDQVTIRKVADRAGYNSATIYNYFSEISHLIFFASMKFLKNYTDDVTIYMNKGKNPFEKYLLAWECFCNYSFQQPQIFHAVFIMDLGDHPEKLIENYYEIYPADLINIPQELKPILFERSMTKRGRSLLEIAAKEGYIKEDQIDSINEMTILLWQGMLTNVLNNRMNYEIEEAANRTMEYVRKIILDASHYNATDASKV